LCNSKRNESSSDFGVGSLLPSVVMRAKVENIRKPLKQNKCSLKSDDGTMSIGVQKRKKVENPLCRR
jgi:hypothetical protein